MPNEGVIRQAWQELEPQLAEQGYELVEVEYVGGPGGRHILRAYIDRDGSGVTLDDCTAAAQLLSTVLDAADFVPEDYVLEVSSPGVERPVRKVADFQRFTGEAIRLATQAPTDGRKNFTGTLRGYRDGLIALECDGRIYEIHIDNLKHAKLDR